MVTVLSSMPQGSAFCHPLTSFTFKWGGTHLGGGGAIAAHNSDLAGQSSVDAVSDNSVSIPIFEQVQGTE